MRSFGVLFFAVLVVGCLPQRGNDSSLSDDQIPNTSDIHLKINLSQFVGKFGVVASVPEAYTTVMYCPGNTCQGRIPNRLTELTARNGRRFFYANAVPMAQGSEHTFEIPGIQNQVRSIRIGPANRANGELRFDEISTERTFSLEGMSSQYRFYRSSQARQQSVPLIVYLHGDTAWSYFNTRNNPRVQIRTDRSGNLMPATMDQALLVQSEATRNYWRGMHWVSVLAPLNSDHGVQTAGNGRDRFATWSNFASSNRQNLRLQSARYLHELLQRELLSRSELNIDRNRIVIVGRSGGSIQLATFIPEYGNFYQGGAVMLCGALPPYKDYQVDRLRGFQLHIETTKGELTHAIEGHDENYYTIIPVAANRYSQIYGKERVTFRDEGNGRHCEFSRNNSRVTEPGLLEPIVRKMLGQRVQTN